MWVLFHVPCPTPGGETARDLYEKRLTGITTEMQESAVEHGCRFHRAWHSADGKGFYAIAKWDSEVGARRFFEEWEIEDEKGEVAIRLLGDVGLVPDP